MSAVPRRAAVLAASCALAAAVLAVAPAAHATFPGRNGVISYTRFAGSDPDIWTIHPDGLGATDIISGSTYQYAGGWSGDGKRISYVTIANPTGEYDLWTADPDGGHPQHALHPLDFPNELVPAIAQNPSLSPDGSTIIFDNQQGIHTVPVGGGPVTTLVAGSSSSFNNNPVYSPDGTKVAFGHFFPGGDATGRIEVLDLANPSSPTLVTDPGNGVDDYQPDWSPDGSKIVFTRFINGQSSHIYMLDLSAPFGSEQDITPNPNHSTDSVSWSPDGTKLLYRDIDQMMIMNADGSNPHPLNDPEPQGVFDQQQHWQPLSPLVVDVSGPSTAPNAGDDVPLTLTLTNLGSDALSSVDVSDPGCDAGAVALVSKSTGPSPDATSSTLDPGDEWTFTCSAHTGANDVVLHNAATAIGTLPSSAVVHGEGSTDVTLVVQVPAGGTASTGSDTTPSDPTATAVTTPVASSITIVEPTTLDSAPTDYAFIGSQFNIDVTSGGDPVQTTASNPLRLVFTVDASLVPSAGVDSLEAFRDGAVIGPCLAAGTANPDPCVESRTIDQATGDAKITVLSTHASHWNLGHSNRAPYPFTGFASPIGPGLNRVKPGSVVPLKFGLGGNLGLSIFAAGFPTMQAIDCTSHAGIGPALQTTTGTLTYDRKTNKYTYSWKSPKSLPTCFALDLKTNDGRPRVALFTTR